MNPLTLDTFIGILRDLHIMSPYSDTLFKNPDFKIFYKPEDVLLDMTSVEYDLDEGPRGSLMLVLEEEM